MSHKENVCTVLSTLWWQLVGMSWEAHLWMPWSVCTLELWPKAANFNFLQKTSFKLWKAWGICLKSSWNYELWVWNNASTTICDAANSNYNWINIFFLSEKHILSRANSHTHLHPSCTRADAIASDTLFSWPIRSKNLIFIHFSGLNNLKWCPTLFLSRMPFIRG